MKSSVISALIVAVAGLSQPAVAFAYGISTSQSGHHLRWDVDTVAFRMDPELEAVLPQGQILAATNMAFDAWRGLPRVPDLMLRPGTPVSPGHHDGGPTNGLYLIRDWQGKPDQLAVTVVTYSGDTGRVLDADILVNANAAYGLLNESSPDTQHYDIGAILTHEAGHSLGLDESRFHPEATMWPSVNLGDTHQRSISDDDEEGVIANYASEMPLPVAGCGNASVTGRPAQRAHVLFFALAALAAGLWLSRRSLRGLPRPTLAFGLAGLVLVAPSAGSSDASSTEASARASADESATVTESARVAQQAMLARLPHGWVSSREPQARVRLEAALGHGAAEAVLVHGHSHTLAAAWQNGLIVTQHVVRDDAGAEHRIASLGGEVDGIGQLVSDSEAGPIDGAEVVLGSNANDWAYSQNGLLFGGALGDGPAIRIER
jgi:hypothetical protein